MWVCMCASVVRLRSRPFWRPHVTVVVDELSFRRWSELFCHFPLEWAARIVSSISSIAVHCVYDLCSACVPMPIILSANICHWWSATYVCGWCRWQHYVGIYFLFQRCCEWLGYFIFILYLLTLDALLAQVAGAQRTHMLLNRMLRRTALSIYLCISSVKYWFPVNWQHRGGSIQTPVACSISYSTRR